jgi:type IV pilus assembly protein PilY1
MFQSGFDPATWSGSLAMTKVSKSDYAAAAGGNVQWDAGTVLTGTDGYDRVPPKPLPESRRIFTGRRNADKSFSMVEFQWSKLNDSQRDFLNISPDTKKTDGLGELRVAYLRGDRRMEASKPGGLFRKRNNVLGDIVNSNSVFVAGPSARVQGGGYQDFQRYNNDRTKAVYVGANDGMLHAFDAEDGSELFAYIPDALFSSLPALTSPAYPHRPYIDGGIDISDAMAGGKWRTVLAAGMGGGAQGVFVLDVTQPSSFGSGLGALFEFTDADDPDMGNLMGTPLVAKFRMRGKGPEAEYKYFVVVPSGLNNYRDDGKGLFNKDGAGALFLLSLDKPPSEPWKLGVNYYKFRTPSIDASLANGLATPALAVDASGAVRYAYAGDLQGNIWRFDFTGGVPWKNALASAAPIFTARDEKGARQPIVMQPRVVFAPGGGYVVLFGTGRYVEEADATPGTFRSQSIYGILDTTETTYRVTGRSDLTRRTLTTTSAGVTSISGGQFEYGAGGNEKKGWYLDFDNSARTGERAITNPSIVDGLLYFNTMVPNGSFCPFNSGRGYVLNALTGLTTDGASAGLMVSSQMAMPVLVSTQVGNRNPVGRRAIRKTYSILDPISNGENVTMAQSGNRNKVFETSLSAGRLGWREIPNWQELKNAIGKK